MKINANKIKTGLFYYYRTKKQHFCCATECGDFNADFITINPDNELIEVEIKISLNDLKNDFNKRKHTKYKENNLTFVPTYFYYCVPEGLVDKCKKILKENNLENYGILVFRELTGLRSLIDSSNR